MQSKKFAIFFSFFLTIFTFQNCSDVSFDASQVDALNGQLDTTNEQPTDDNIVKPLPLVENPVVLIEEGNRYTNSESVQVSLLAENATEYYLTNDQSCQSGGQWSPFNGEKTLSQKLNQLNTTVAIYAKFRNPDLKESSCVSDSILHDSVAPLLEFVGGVNQGDISSGNDYSIKYSITETGSGVDVMDCLFNDEKLECPSMTEVRIKDVSIGQQELRIELTDLAKNDATYTLPWSVVDKLGMVSFTINGGQDFTKDKNVKFDLFGENANSMRISTDPSCQSGDIEAYKASKLGTLAKENAQNTYYAQFYNEAGDVSPCLAASIIHDNLPPQILVDSLISNGAIVHGPENLRVEILEEGSGLKSHSCKHNGKALQCNLDETFQLSFSEEGEQNILISAYDNAGNSSTEKLDFDFLKNIQNMSLLIDGGAQYTNSPDGQVTLTLEAKNAKEMYITNDESCMQGGVWTSFANSKKWTLAQLNQNDVPVFARFRNTEKVVSECISASIIHDSIPHDIEFVDPQLVFRPEAPKTIKYVVKDKDVELNISEVSDYGNCKITHDGDVQTLNCPDFGSIEINELVPGNYTVSVETRDQAGNTSSKSHEFLVEEDVPHCNNPLFADQDLIGECLALVDTFDRDTVTGGDQFNWTSIIDDTLRTDFQNVQANIFKNGEHGFGEAAHGDSAVYLTGRKGGSVHEVFLISVPLDLAKFDRLRLEFNYLPIHLETWNFRGQSGIENIRLELCSSSLHDCGLEGSNEHKKQALRSSNWSPLFVQDGYLNNSLTDIERGLNFNGRNHTQASWLKAKTDEIDLQNSVLDKSQVVFRVVMMLDEGFMKEKSVNGSKVPDFASDIEDGIGLDMVKAFAIQNQKVLGGDIGNSGKGNANP